MEDSDEIQEVNLDCIGGGSFGIVYRIKNSKRPIVLKLPHHQHDGPSPVLEKECMALKNLDHGHIVKYYGIGKVFQKESRLYQYGILMEYCAKKSLEKWLYNPIVTYEMSTVVWWSQQLMSALEYLHGKEMVHRDIKPENILVTEKFVLKLGDFGLTKLEHHTTVGASMAGTKKYMSPERWSDTSAEKRMISRRSDVYSLGLVMWEMIERREIFACPATATDYSINAGAKPFFEFEPLTCGHEMRNIIEKCTVFEYEKRPYASGILQEISEICKRLGRPPAMPRIDNNQIRVLKPMELETITRLPSPVELVIYHLLIIYSLQECPSDSGPLLIHPTLPQHEGRIAFTTYQGSNRSIGWFSCRCGHHCKSHNTWSQESQNCQKCGGNSFPRKMKPLPRM